MRNLIVLGFVGLLAQLVDGSLGMAYGVTSSTLLLATGIAPAAAPHLDLGVPPRRGRSRSNSAWRSSIVRKYFSTRSR